MKRLTTFVVVVMLAVMLTASAGSRVMAATSATTQTLYHAQVPADTASDNSTVVLAAPVIIGPADNTLVPINIMRGVPEVVVLAWNRAADASRHTVQVADDSTFTQNIYTIIVDYPTLECSIGQGNNGVTFIFGKTYYWRVRASAPFESPYSKVRSFTCQGISTGGPPIMTSPMNGATITNQNPEFTWPPVTGTTKYEFQLSTTPTFGTTVFTDTPQATGMISPIKLETSKQYFWRVRALEPKQSDWSQVSNFLIINPSGPTAVTVIIQDPVINFPTPVPTITPVDTKEKQSIWERIIAFFKNLF
jgi:hypothetical protein